MSGRVYFDPALSDDQRGATLYTGRLLADSVREPLRRVRAILEVLGSDRERTTSGVSRLRSSTGDEYLTQRIACAWHPHRGAWYVAPAYAPN